MKNQIINYKMKKKRLAIILGIRPDVIRASLILNSIRTSKEFDVKFIWSGQHYSDNLKDVFFRELNVKPPDIELGAGGNTDAEISALAELAAAALVHGVNN